MNWEEVSTHLEAASKRHLDSVMEDSRKDPHEIWYHATLSAVFGVLANAFLMGLADESYQNTRAKPVDDAKLDDGTALDIQRP